MPRGRRLVAGFKGCLCCAVVLLCCLQEKLVTAPLVGMLGTTQISLGGGECSWNPREREGGGYRDLQTQRIHGTAATRHGSPGRLRLIRRNLQLGVSIPITTVLCLPVGCYNLRVFIETGVYLSHKAEFWRLFPKGGDRKRKALQGLGCSLVWVHVPRSHCRGLALPCYDHPQCPLWST